MSAQYLYIYSNQTDCFTKVIATSSGLAHPEMSFNSLICAHYLFINSVLLRGMLCITIRAHNRDMKCNDCMELLIALFPGSDN